MADVQGEKGTVVMFICNHCPFVQAILDDIIQDMRDLRTQGVSAVAIMPNDVSKYPKDGPDEMRSLAESKHFPFPYLFDATQEVAKAYDAVCTPDFFGFDADLTLQYRGRLHPRDQATPTRELYDAMCQIAQGGKAPQVQHPSMGCSIKWKA